MYFHTLRGLVWTIKVSKSKCMYKFVYERGFYMKYFLEKLPVDHFQFAYYNLCCYLIHEYFLLILCNSDIIMAM